MSSTSTVTLSPGITILMPSGSITEPDIAEKMRAYYEDIAIPAESFAHAVVFAMSQPEEVDVNEILFRPTKQML